MDFLFGLPKDVHRNTGIAVFVDRLRKMAHLALVPDCIDGEGTATKCIDRLLRQHGLSLAITLIYNLSLLGSIKVHLQGARHKIGHVRSGSYAYRWFNRVTEKSRYL